MHFQKRRGGKPPSPPPKQNSEKQTRETMLEGYMIELVLEVLILNFVRVVIFDLLGINIFGHLPHLQDVILRHRRAYPVIVWVPTGSRENKRNNNSPRGGSGMGIMWSSSSSSRSSPDEEELLHACFYLLRNEHPAHDTVCLLNSFRLHP